MNTGAILKSLKNNLQARKSFIVCQKVKKISGKEYEHVLKVWNKFEVKTIKDYDELYLKYELLLSADAF